MLPFQSDPPRLLLTVERPCRTVQDLSWVAVVEEGNCENRITTLCKQKFLNF